MTRGPRMDRTPLAKTEPPARPTALLDRPALVDLIEEVLERRLTIVVAEAGFGKSTLLTSWWDRGPCAWYALDRTDLDLTALEQGLMASLRRRVPNLPVGLGGAAGGTPADEGEALGQADSLGCHLADAIGQSLAGELVLIIDELHELRPGGPSVRLIEALCRHAPPNLHLVVSGRR